MAAQRLPVGREEDMTTRVKPFKPGEHSDPEVNDILAQMRDSWWNDSAMMGTLAHCPSMLKSIVAVFGSFFGTGKIDPHIHELMRLKTGQINDCAY